MAVKGNDDGTTIEIASGIRCFLRKVQNVLNDITKWNPVVFRNIVIKLDQGRTLCQIASYILSNGVMSVKRGQSSEFRT